MLLIRRPDEAEIWRFLDAQKSSQPTYDGVGETRGTPPKGYAVDRNRVQLGQGRVTFERAANALRGWRMFELGWVELCWPKTPIEVGSTVAILVRQLGLWSLHASRIVYVIDDRVPIRRFGFACGTLPDHAERGEERFTVELRPDGWVWYDLYSFSRPNHWYAKVGRPFGRALQKRFARDSMAAMLRASTSAD